MESYKSKGIISYKNNDGWIVINVHPSIPIYYKSFIEKTIGKKITTSYHGCHISVLKAKHEGDFTKHPNWGKFQGKTVEFTYNSKIYTDNKWFMLGRYFWLQVECKLISEIRVGLGLPPNLIQPFHLTIGYCGTKSK